MAAAGAFLALLANSAPCALKLGEHARAANLATAAGDPRLRLRARAVQEGDGPPGARAGHVGRRRRRRRDVQEAQLRGLTAPDFDAIMRKAGRTSIGALGDGHEPRMFVMLGLRLSTVARTWRGFDASSSSSLPPVDRRDGRATTSSGAPPRPPRRRRTFRERRKGGSGDTAEDVQRPDRPDTRTCTAWSTCQRYDGGKTLLMYAAGSTSPRCARDAGRHAGEGRRSASEARGRGRRDWAGRLMEHPEDPVDSRLGRRCGRRGWTPLMVALMMKDDAPKENVGAKPMGEGATGGPGHRWGFSAARWVARNVDELSLHRRRCLTRRARGGAPAPV